MSERLPERPKSEILLYQTEDGESRVQVRLQGGTVWLTQTEMAELYQTTPQNISIHIRAIYADGEVDADVTCREYVQEQREANRQVRRRRKFYNLDMVLAVGYRVRSNRGVAFRRWATEHLREYLVKGFVMDDDRLKDGRHLGVDYFDELLERIRDIRASEKRFYQKIRDIYKLSVDYDAKAEETREFFKIVQNKLHWAVSGLTAAELIAERADASKPNMGLTSWSGSKVRKADVTVAKNYLQGAEIEELNRVVVMYLDYAEDQARRRHPLYMRDWRAKLDAFLRFNEREILTHAGRVSKEVADRLALDEYDKYHQTRLADEARQEALADDQELRQLADAVEARRKD